jgi:cell division protein FtsL
MKGDEENGKPTNFLDFVDNNLKNVVIGVIAAVAVMIITLVCCCVCCAATVCNRATKNRDDIPKQKMYAAEVQDYLQHFHPLSDLNKTPETSSNIHDYSPASPWKSPCKAP